MIGTENFEELLENYLPEEVAKGKIIEGEILRKDREYAYLDIKSKLEGRVRSEEVEEFEEGATIKVMVQGESSDASYIKASRRAVELEENWSKLKEVYSNSDVVEGKVMRKVNGGYVVEVLKYHTYLPSSLSGVKDNEAASFIDTKINVVVKDIKEGKRKKILVSRKDVKLKEENAYLEKLNVGDVLEVKIKEILDFGLSVEIGPTVGFIHISEVSWKKVDKLKEMFNVGDAIEAKIITLDQAKKSLKLSIKQLSDDPWKEIGEKYPIGTELEGKVTRVVKFGAFVEIENGIEGLVHVSDLTWSKKIKNVEEYMQVGDAVKVKVIELKPQDKKLKLGIKQLSPNPWEVVKEKYDIGSVVKGQIVEVKDFGIFVEIEAGVDIFVHISDLAWMKEEAKEYKIGDEVEVKILEADFEKRKLKGGVKQLIASPWERVKSNYKVGDVITRKITSITDFGIFVEVEKGIDGMIHISEASKDFIKNLEDRFEVGQEVTSEIIEINDDKEKLKLSIKKIELEEAKEEEQELIEKYGTVGEE